ncbi:MAG: hypothetical protein D6674_03940 [Acidobacteria bacterium]|nr:MAG: hypothetical protein D6674_03940 [Acidobacteriota bacterium]
MSEGHHAVELVWKGLNILAFLGIVYWLGRKPISEAFNRYFHGLTERLLSSEKELSQAREDINKAQESLQDAQRRYQEQLKLAHETARLMKEEEEKKSQEVASRIKDKAREVIDIELKKAKEELLRYGSERAKEIAVDMLNKRFEDKQLQKAYIEKTLKKLEAQG